MFNFQTSIFSFHDFFLIKQKNIYITTILENWSEYKNSFQQIEMSDFNEFINFTGNLFNCYFYKNNLNIG